MFSTRELVLVSLFSGVFLAYGYASGVSLPQAITHSLDLFFLIAALFTILALEIRQSWSATLLGTISGVIFLGTPGAPAPWHITLALIGNGLVFDGYLRLMSRKTIPPSKWHMVGAASLGNLVMAIVGLSALQATSLQTNTQPLPLLPWAGLVVVTGFLGAAGALFGIAVVRRLRVSTRDQTRTISMESSTIQPGQIRQ
jgi:hypothetical protein